VVIEAASGVISRDRSTWLRNQRTIRPVSVPSIMASNISRQPPPMMGAMPVDSSRKPSS